MLSDWVTSPRDIWLVAGMVFFIAVAFAVIIGFIVREKGYAMILGMVLGFFLGPIGLFIGMILPSRAVDADRE
jgi:hypothetical protein